MPFRHLLIALLVVAVWGINFIFVKFALQDLPPITLGAIRFFLVAFPAIFFIPRPKIRFSSLVAYGILNFAFQFSFLFSGMKMGMSPGLSSMILQTQVFFTMALASIFLKEQIKIVKILGALISFSGVALVSLHSGQDVNLLGLLLLIGGALSWATGNIISKGLGPVKPLSLVVWGGLIACPVLTAFALIVEGPEGFLSLVNSSATTAWSVLYIVYASTHLAYSLWSWLLSKHSASTVAPFTLLVPVFGMASSALIFKEEIADWKIYAGLLVIGGLSLNIYGSKKTKA